MTTKEENREWLDHPITHELLKQTKKAAEQALEGLLHVAESSSDAAVVRAVTVYRQLNERLRILAEGRRSESGADVPPARSYM